MLNLLNLRRVLWIELFLSSEVKPPELVGIVEIPEDEVEGEVDQDIFQLLFNIEVSTMIHITELVQVVEELGDVDYERIPHQQKGQGGPVDMASKVETNAGEKITGQINA